MSASLETALIGLIHQLPLELFVFIASFIEEVIAPIPSAAVLVISGSFAAVQERSTTDLIPLVFIAALGKSIGAIIVYFLADKLSRLFFSRAGGKFFSVSNEAIAELSHKIIGGPRDYLILALCRALPILPSSVVSIGSGILKVPFRMFVITTLIGTVLRDSVFIYAGYKGTDLFTEFVNHSTNIESFIQFAAVVGILSIFVIIYFRRRHS